MHAGRHRMPHHRVVGGMKLDVVDASAMPVEWMEDRPVAVGQFAQRHQLAAGQSAVCIQVVRCPVSTMPGYGLAQWDIDTPQVALGQWLRLIFDVMCEELRFYRHVEVPAPSNITSI